MCVAALRRLPMPQLVLCIRRDIQGTSGSPGSSLTSRFFYDLAISLSFSDPWLPQLGGGKADWGHGSCPMGHIILLSLIQRCCWDAAVQPEVCAPLRASTGENKVCTAHMNGLWAGQQYILHMAVKRKERVEVLSVSPLSPFDCWHWGTEVLG